MHLVINFLYFLNPFGFNIRDPVIALFSPCLPWIFWKGYCHKIFCFRFFSWVIFPQAPENNSRVILHFFKISRRYSQVKVHRYQQQRWQILPPVLLVAMGNADTLKWTWKKNCIYMLTTYPMVFKKIIKTFLIEDLRLLSTNTGGTP